MKVPRTRPGEGAQSLLGFETEAAVLPLLDGPHVPRFDFLWIIVPALQMAAAELSFCVFFIA